MVPPRQGTIKNESSGNLLGLTLSSASMSSFLALHTWIRLKTFCDISVTLGMSLSLTPVALEHQMSCGDVWTQIGPATLILVAHTLVTSSWWRSDLSLGRAAVKTHFLCLLQKPNSLLGKVRAKALYPRETPKDFGYQQNTATEMYEDNLAWLIDDCC